MARPRHRSKPDRHQANDYRCDPGAASRSLQKDVPRHQNQHRRRLEIHPEGNRRNTEGREGFHTHVSSNTEGCEDQARLPEEDYRRLAREVGKGKAKPPARPDGLWKVIVYSIFPFPGSVCLLWEEGQKGKRQSDASQERYRCTVR
jgi:hypothetical protein